MISGLYGSGVTIFIYLSMYGFFDFIYTVLPNRETDELIYNFDIGIYLTGFFSLLLFLTSFSKSENNGNFNSIAKQKVILEQESILQFKGHEKHNKTNINE